MRTEDIHFGSDTADQFKTKLLVRRKALVTAYDAAGEVVWSKSWEVKQLADSSNLVGNIKTRSDIRLRTELPAIVRVHVELA